MKIVSSPTIGAALRRARLAAGMEQGALAARIGISQPTLNKVEFGHRGFETKWLEKMPAGISRQVKQALVSEVSDLAVSDPSRGA